MVLSLWYVHKALVIGTTNLFRIGLNIQGRCEILIVAPVRTRYMYLLHQAPMGICQYKRPELACMGALVHERRYHTTP